MITRDAAMIVMENLVMRLTPHCERIEPAGSYRRGSQELHDIEVVCIPKYHEVDNYKNSLFPVRVNEVTEYLDTLSETNRATIIKNGSKYIQMRFMGIMVDVFMTTREDWGRQLAIRTGPAQFSHDIAKRWREMGWQGVNGILLRTEDKRAFEKYQLTHPTTYMEFQPTPPPVFLEEKEFFAWLGWSWIPPEKRVVKERETAE